MTMMMATVVMMMVVLVEIKYLVFEGMFIYKLVVNARCLQILIMSEKVL